MWGAPFEVLQGSIPTYRDPQLWQKLPELKEQLQHANALVVRNRTQVTNELIIGAPNLKVIARAGVGLDNIDIESADAHGIVVVAALGANARGVGELTVGLALALLRTIPTHDAATRDGNWIRTQGRELSGCTWGLLGCGATGLATAKLLQGFGCTIVGYDPFVQGEDPQLVSLGITLTTFENVLKASDVVSIHMPSNTETHGVINAQSIGFMKRDAILISVGRGEVINESDLLVALKTKKIAGAALDVRAKEPPTKGELESLPNVILTPHIAGITDKSQLLINQILATNIELVLQGKSATHAVGAIRKCTK